MAKTSSRPRSKDMTGFVCGRLIAYAHLGKIPDGGKRQVWLCLCDCGRFVPVTRNRLITGNTRSCGCLNRDRRRESGAASRKHGMAGTSTYHIWDGMRARCHNEQSKDYPRYGGRGITVCDRWRESFDNFLSDMGARPKGLTLERIDGTKGYEPGNCRWATMKEQQNNRRNNVVLEHGGRRLTVAQWADEIGISTFTLYARVRLGWSADRVLSLPVQRRS